MASIAPLPPTPQQSLPQMAPPPAGSPVSAHQQYSSQPNGQPHYGHTYNMSFDSPQHAPLSQPTYAHSFSGQSFPNGPVSGAGYSRSFAEGYGASAPQPVQRGFEGKPQIYTVGCIWFVLE